MKELLDKLSSYNLINNLFPGIVFVLVTSKYTAFNYMQDNLVIGVFIYYFIGLVISRIGSLIVEPILKYFTFLKYADYKDYVHALQKDSSIAILLEVNNMYRTICSLFLVVFILKAYEKLEIIIGFLPNWRSEILITSMLLLFLFSYKKLTNYIVKRVHENIKNL